MYDTITIHVRYKQRYMYRHRIVSMQTDTRIQGPAYPSQFVSKLYRYCIVRAPEPPIDAVSELGIVFVSSMYRSLITIQYPKCIQRVSKWYRKTIQYRSPDGAKNVSCVFLVFLFFRHWWNHWCSTRWQQPGQERLLKIGVLPTEDMEWHEHPGAKMN